MKIFSKLRIASLILLFLAYPLAKTYQTHHRPMPVFGLLLPAGAEKTIGAKIWLRAASEEGVPLEPISEETFVDPFQTGEIESKAILVPDEIAQNASSTLISYLQKYVGQGGKLILVGDALMYELNGRLRESFPAETYFGFPKVLGRVGDTIQLHRDTLRITDSWKNKLQIPPGQYTPPEPKVAPFREFCTYQTLHALYPHWKTDTTPFSGTPILESGDGSLVAGVQKIGQGEVLWINLPLSFLKRRTDGLLMHSFLRWMSEDWLGFPKLLSVPDGIGGIVLNLHVDSNAALPYLKKLKDQGFFEEGPFSIHVTAGPDTRAVGDGVGFDLPGNKASQAWIRYWLERGHEVGSHGGWIHDYFGEHLSEKKTPEFVDYLEKNFDSLEEFMGKPPVEYSAPLGNQPLWVNSWLRKKGYRSYYFVGDNGMAPTQNFRDTEFADEDLWSYPIASYLQMASFEEAEDQKVPKDQITFWLKGLTRFVSENQTSRLFYFHPPGIRFYQSSLNQWRVYTQELLQKKTFRWYTMNQLSTFLTRRNDLKWSIVSLDADNAFELVVEGCDNLKQMVWRIPKKTAKNLKVVSGKAAIEEIALEYLVHAENDHGFKLSYEDVPSVH